MTKRCWDSCNCGAPNPGKRWDKDTVAQWMLDEGHWKQPKAAPRKELAKLLVKAAKKKRVRNVQGKRVRVWHAATFEFPSPKGPIQQTLWDHRETMTADFAEVSFAKRYSQAAGFCRSLYDDIEDFNLNNKHSEGHQIQMEFDFTTIVEGPAQQKVEEITPSSSDSDAAKHARRQRDRRKERQPR